MFLFYVTANRQIKTKGDQNEESIVRVAERLGNVIKKIDKRPGAMIDLQKANS